MEECYLFLTFESDEENCEDKANEDCTAVREQISNDLDFSLESLPESLLITQDDALSRIK